MKNGSHDETDHCLQLPEGGIGSSSVGNSGKGEKKGVASLPRLFLSPENFLARALLVISFKFEETKQLGEHYTMETSYLTFLQL